MGELDDLIAKAREQRSQDMDAQPRGELNQVLEAARAQRDAQGGGGGVGTMVSDPDTMYPPVTEQPAPYEPGLLERLLAGTPGGVLNRAANNPGYVAAAQGLAHGATAGLDQNIPGYGDYVRNERKQAQAQAPGAYRGGDIVGSLVSPTNITGSIPRQVASGALQGGARGFSDANPDAGIAPRVVNGVISAGLGAGAAAAIGGAGRFVGALEPGGQAVADRARNIGYGTSAEQLAEFARQRGLTTNEALRTLVSEGEQIAPPNLLKPISPGAYEPQFANAARGYDQQISRSLLDAQADGVPFDPNARGNLLHALDSEADSAMTAGTNRVPYANAVRGEADAVARGPTIDTPQALREAKGRFGETAYGEDPAVGQAASRQAADFARGTARDQLQSYVDQASPGVQAAFNEGNRGAGTAITLRDATAARARAIATGSGGGVGTGFGGMGRALNMIPGGSLLPDAAANVFRGVQSPGSGANGFANTAAGPVGGNAAAAAAAKWLGSKGVQTGQQPANTQVGDSTATGHGNRLGAAADQLLRENPQAFGQWLDDFQKAEQEGSGAMSALVGRLMIDDPGFRSGPGLQLQQMSR